MKKLSTLVLAALMATPAVMADDVTVSLNVRKGSAANITIGDFLGSMTNKLIYDTASKTYSITNFLGYNNGNLDFTVDATEKFTSGSGEVRFPLMFSIPSGSTIKSANSANSKWAMSPSDYDEWDIEDMGGYDNFYDQDSGIFEGNDNTEFSAMKLVDAYLWGVCEDTSNAAFDNIKVRSYAVANGNGYKFVIEVNPLGIRYSNGGAYSYDDYPEDNYDFGLNYVAVFSYPEAFSGIDEVVVAQDGDAEYFNLIGVRVENPSNGLYIKRQGGKTEKVIIR